MAIFKDLDLDQQGSNESSNEPKVDNILPSTQVPVKRTINIDRVHNSTQTPESMQYGTGDEDIGDGSHYSHTGHTFVHNAGSWIAGALNDVVAGSGLGQVGQQVKQDLNRAYYDVKAMIKDPRYAVYKGLNLLRKSVVGEFEVDERIMPDMNTSEGNKLLRRGFNALSSLDPTGGVLSTITAKKLQTLIQKSSINPNDWKSIILAEAQYRRSINDIEKSLDYGTDLADFSMEDPATGTKRKMLNIYSNSGKSNNQSEIKLSTKSIGANRQTLFNSSFKGYKTVQGLSIGTNYLWDFTLDNYFPTIWVDDESTTGKERLMTVGTYAPQIPITIGAETKNTMGTFVPVLSFEYKDYVPTTTQVDLINGANIEFLTGLKRNNRLSVTFLDDENFTWSRYFDLYMRCIYDRENNCVAPYKQSVLKAGIALYNPLKKVYFYHQLLVIPIDFERRVEGEENPNALDFNVEFCVVGDLDSVQSIS